MSEYEIQCLFVGHLTKLKQEGKIRRFSALPLSTYTPSYQQKTKNILSGVRAGVPDMLILTKYSTVFIELKKNKRSKPTPNQITWLEDLSKCNNFAFCCHSLDEAIKSIETVINNE